VWPGFNDIGTTHPKYAKTLADADAQQFTAGSEKILKWKCELGHIYELSVKKRIGRNYGCPYCSHSKLLVGFNDFATKHPDLVNEADGWDPTSVIGGSAALMSWKCPKGHKYRAKVSSRDANKSGCPYCANQSLLKGFNDLATTHPQLALQADGWDPSTVINGSKKVAWVCSEGHKTSASISVRKSGSGCRVCSNQEVLKGFNDLQSRYPKVANQAFGWDPSTVTSGSSKKKEWICSQGHKWIATIASRTNLESGCPTCATGGGFDPNQKGYLYFLTHPHWKMFQIGITNVPEDRMARHKKSGWEILEIRGPMDGQLTKQWETAILQMLRASGADLSNSLIAGKFDGYSEAWSWTTFNASSLKDLMEITENFENLGKTRG
jgi:hypothetical protein